MDVERAKDALGGTRFEDLRWVAETGSTNADLVAVARSGGGACALIADHQTAGRGRLDRRWEAPPGAALLLSVLVPEDLSGGDPHAAVTAMGVAAAEVLEGLSERDRFGLKWPNDIVESAGGRKVGGLLAELEPGVTPGAGAIVIGIGCNVAWAGGFPPDLAATATSLDSEGVHVDRVELATSVLRHLDAWLTELSGVGVGRLHDEYRRRCVTLGRRVRVELPASTLEGVATDLSRGGALVVRDDAGDLHEVTVGDVVHLRPA